MHSSVLAWRIPGTGEPGGVPSMGSHRVGPQGVRPRLEGKPRTPLSSRVATRVSWSPLSGLKGTPVFLPGESQGRRGLVGCRLWGHTESDMTEVILFRLERGPGIALQAMQEKKALSSRGRGRLCELDYKES